MRRHLASILATLLLASQLPAAFADTRTDQRLEESREVFESFTNLTEQSIPSWMLERAYGIVVVPNVIKGALGIGGRGGRGVMAVRNPDGSWSNPVFVTLAGVNFGFQFGVQSTDVVLVLMSRRSVEGIAGGTVTLGADASVAAGPLGRAAAATTDATLKAQVLSYSRNEGIFAGVALDGTVISVDDSSNASAYGVSGVLASQILEGRIAAPPAAAVAFTASLNKVTGGGATGAAPVTPVEPAPAEPGSVTTAPPVPGDETAPATTYPMEDPSPGAPPPE
jgi:lipid-binding SYLF domain-containing protein